MIEFKEIIQRLVDGEGPVIGAAAVAGDEHAIKVIQMYEMVYRCPENGAIALLEAYYDEWTASRPR